MELDMNRSHASELSRRAHLLALDQLVGGGRFAESWAFQKLIGRRAQDYGDSWQSNRAGDFKMKIIFFLFFLLSIFLPRALSALTTGFFGWPLPLALLLFCEL